MLLSGALGAVVADEGGSFTRDVFPFVLAANPADAFRIFNLAASESIAMASGVGMAGNSVPQVAILASMFGWPLLALMLAHLLLRRSEP